MTEKLDKMTPAHYYNYEVKMADRKDRRKIIGAIILEDNTTLIIHRDGAITVAYDTKKWKSYIDERFKAKVQMPYAFTFNRVEISAIVSGMITLAKWDKQISKATKGHKTKN